MSMRLCIGGLMLAVAAALAAAQSTPASADPGGRGGPTSAPWW